MQWKLHQNRVPRSHVPCPRGTCDMRHMREVSSVLCLQTIFGVTRRNLQTPGNAEEHKRQETPTINPIGPTDKPHRPSTKHYRTTERTARETHNTNKHSSSGRFSTTIFGVDLV